MLQDTLHVTPVILSIGRTRLYAFASEGRGSQIRPPMPAIDMCVTRQWNSAPSVERSPLGGGGGCVLCLLCASVASSWSFTACEAASAAVAMVPVIE